MIFIRPVVAATDRELATAAFPGGIVFQGFRNRLRKIERRSESCAAWEEWIGVECRTIARPTKTAFGSESLLVLQPGERSP